MGFFSPHKRHANKFNYIPRYYDPVKEAREQRRAELRGERMDQNEEEYTPGKYIKAKREAREMRRAQEQQEHRADKRTKMWTMGVGLVLIALFIYMIVPRLGAIFEMATTDKAVREQAQQQLEIEEFNPYAPIVIVPNDYEEGDELEIKDIEME